MYLLKYKTTPPGGLDDFLLTVTSWCGLFCTLWWDLPVFEDTLTSNLHLHHIYTVIMFLSCANAHWLMCELFLVWWFWFSGVDSLVQVCLMGCLSCCVLIGPQPYLSRYHCLVRQPDWRLSTETSSSIICTWRGRWTFCIMKCTKTSPVLSFPSHFVLEEV